MPKRAQAEGPSLLVHTETMSERVPIGDDAHVPSSFTAIFKLPKAMVELWIKAESGRVRVEEVRVSEREPTGVTGVVVDGVAVSELLERSTASMAWITSRSGAGQARTAARQASRKAVSGDRLRAVADAFEAGGIAAVVAQENVTERHAWRLKAQAVDRGYLEEGSDGER